MKRRYARFALPLVAWAMLGTAPGLRGLQAAAAATPRPSAGEAQFRAANPCPATGLAQGACKGYVVDRIIPQICGGADAASNMQWLTLAEAKAKARWDRIGCRGGRKLVLPGTATSSTEAFALDGTAAPVEAQALPPGSTGPRAAPAPAQATEQDDTDVPHD